MTDPKESELLQRFPLGEDGTVSSIMVGFEEKKLLRFNSDRQTCLLLLDDMVDI